MAISEVAQNETEPPLVASVHDPLTYTRIKGRSTRELGATKHFHADCPCCGYRFAVDHSTAEQSMMNRTEQTLKRKIRDRMQEWFTNGPWKWATREREQTGPNRSKGIRSGSVEAVVQTGAGPLLSWSNEKAKKKGWRIWFAVLWHQAPVLGEMFFACKLGDLFNVLQAIADDSPEFAYRLRLAADNSLKRDGSAARRGRHDEVAAKAGEGGVEPFDPGTAVRV